MKTRKIARIGLASLVLAGVWLNPSSNIADHKIPQSYYQVQEIQRPQKETVEVKNSEAKEELPKIPVYSRREVKPGMCAQYARRVTESMGNEITSENAWSLHKVNHSISYKGHEPEEGDIVTFVNRESRNFRPGRRANHAACLVHKGRDGKLYFAHQFGYNTKLNTLEEIEGEGYTPVDIIRPRKIKADSPNP